MVGRELVQVIERMLSCVYEVLGIMERYWGLNGDAQREDWFTYLETPCQQSFSALSLEEQPFHRPSLSCTTEASLRGR
jgi:hypothetical protein